MEALLFCFGYKKINVEQPFVAKRSYKKDLLFIQTDSEGGLIETEVIDETVIAN